MTDFNLRNLIDLNKLQEMFSDFYAATGYSVGIISTDGEILVKSGWQDICEKYHRAQKECLENCLKSDKIINYHLGAGDFYDYKCLNGLVDAAIPIMIRGEHLASVFFGQFFYEDEVGKEEDFRAQAIKYGFNEKQYLEAFRKIPVYSRQQVKSVIRFCKTVVDMITASGDKNLLLKEELQKEKEYEEKLEEQGRYLDSIFNGTEVSIFVIDVSEDGRFIFNGLNKTHERTSGFKSEDLAGKTPDDLIDFMPLEAIKEVKKHYQDCVDAGKAIQYEEMIPMLGKDIWWFTTLTPLFDSKGKVFRIIGSAICINQLKEVQNELKKHKENLEELVKKKTEELRATNADLLKEIDYRKEITLELQHSEEQYRRIFSSVTNAIFIIDDCGIIVETNRAASELYGYKKDEFIGLPVARLIREDYHRELERFTKTIQAGKIFHGETIDVRKDRSELHTFVTGREILFRGRPHFMAVINDLTDLKQAQKEIDRFFEITLSLLCIAGTDGYFKKLNPAWFELLGYDEEVLLKHKFFDFVHPDDIKRTQKVLEKLSEGKTAVNFENRYRCKDASFRWLNWTAIPRGDVIYAAAIDITQIKEIEDKLKKSNQELEQFAYVASHDLQEPLRKISSFVELIRQRYDSQLDEKGKRFMAYVVDGAQRMQNQISSLLDFSRVSSRAKPFTSADLKSIMRNVLANLAMNIEEKNADVSYDYLPEITADENQMQSLLQNLISNALKFCKDRDPQIIVRYEESETDWKFSVEDNGIGIDQENQDRVFMIFQRLHTASEIPGTGIGLAMCKKIVERHGGRIWFESKLGEGTTFFFTIAKGLSKGEN